MHIDPRKLAALFLAVLAVIGLSARYQDQIAESTDLQFWIQVLVGNWAPPQGWGSGQPMPVNRFWFSISAILGILLNFSAVLAIVMFVPKLLRIQIQERMMLLAEALKTRDRTIKTRLITGIVDSLPDHGADVRQTVRRVIEEAFSRGNEFWLRRHMRRLIGRKGIRELEAKLHEEVSQQWSAHTEDNMH